MSEITHNRIDNQLKELKDSMEKFIETVMSLLDKQGEAIELFRLITESQHKRINMMGEEMGMGEPDGKKAFDIIRKQLVSIDSKMADIGKLG